MYQRIIRNDFLKTKWVSITLMLLILAASMLVTLAMMIMINLSGAIDHLMIISKTPHFLQMHTGEVDFERMRSFAKTREEVDEYQILTFLNVEGSQIRIADQSFLNSVQDNGFTVQSEKFDYLLDLGGNRIEAKEGELYVPIHYRKMGIKVGDTAKVCETTLKVAGFLRDSQMNSPLASSKRFLISSKDYEQIKASGKEEYLIEFRLKDLKEINSFQAAYAKAGLEENGPTLTYPLFKMMSAISDGMLAGILIFISCLIVLIAFLCIRFALLTKLEEEIYEIGVMKAIGLQHRDIKMIYLLKYTLLSLIGCLFGWIFAWMYSGVLMKDMRDNFGTSLHAGKAPFIGAIASAAIFLIIMMFVQHTLSYLKKISVLQALRYGTLQTKSNSGSCFSLSKTNRMSPNMYLSMKDILMRKKQFLTLCFVFILSTFIMLVPQNLSNTISSKEFIRYMGVGKSDIRMDMKQSSKISESLEIAQKYLNEDREVKKYVILTTAKYKMLNKQNEEIPVTVEIGDQQVFPVNYKEGKPPITQEEIALSELNSKELQADIGDQICMKRNGTYMKYEVCGIYSDITNGGKTAKLSSQPIAYEDNMGSILYIKVSENAQPKTVSKKYAELFPDSKVSDMKEYMNQTFGETMNSVAKAALITTLISLGIIIFVTVLFLNMLIAKDGYSISVLKAIGFSSRDIKIQYMFRLLLIFIVGTSTGLILANTLGESAVGSVISSFGAGTFQFETNLINNIMLSPAMMLVAVLMATLLGTKEIENKKIVDHIRE